MLCYCSEAGHWSYGTSLLHGICDVTQHTAFGYRTSLPPVAILRILWKWRTLNFELFIVCNCPCYFFMAKYPVIPWNNPVWILQWHLPSRPHTKLQCPSARRPCPVHAKTSGCRMGGTRGPTAGPAVADSPAALGPTFPHSRELCSSDILEQLSSSASNAAVMVSAGGGEEWDRLYVCLLVMLYPATPPTLDPPPPHLQSLYCTPLHQQWLSFFSMFVTMLQAFCFSTLKQCLYQCPHILICIVRFIWSKWWWEIIKSTVEKMK